MTRSLATLLVVGLAVLAQLTATACHAPLEPACAAQAESADSQAEHEEEVVEEARPVAGTLPVGLHRADEVAPPASLAADEILHVPRA